MTVRNLPAQATSFIGRESDLHDLSDLLSDPSCRLLTVTGLGGIGKTRFALTLAEQIQDRFPDGAHFIPLQSLQSPDQLISTVITALGIQVDQTRRDQLLSWLRDQHLLLVLDNFEHLLEGVDLLTAILEAAPYIKLLVTSRDALRLRGEWLHRLAGLDYPDTNTAQPDRNYSAVQLFVERARQYDRYLRIDSQFPHIVRICQLVEGMPLALELAAGWVNVLSCAEIVTELEQSLTLLKSRAHDVPDRHNSMEAVFDYAWQLLTDEERAVLRGYSVFHGGCTRDAAEQVTGANLSVLTSLVEKSLLRHDLDSGRFELHELLRQYAAGKLNQSPEIREIVLDRHCDYYTQYLHQQATIIHVSSQAHVLVDFDNVRLSWKRAAQQGNQTALLRAATNLYWLYHVQAWFDEGAAVFYLAEESVSELSMTDDNRLLLGMMRLFRGYYSLRQPGHSTHAPVDVEAALALWEGLEERPEMGLPLSRAVLTLMGRRSDPKRVVAAVRKSLAFHQHYNDLSGVAIALTTLASVSCDAFGEFIYAQELLEQALAIDRQIGFNLNAGWSESVLNTITYLQGRYEEARVHAEAWVGYRQIGSIPSALDLALHALGYAALELDDDTAAKTHFEESIKVAADQQRHDGTAQGRAGLGILAALQDDINTAAAHYADSQAALRSSGLNPWTYDDEPENLGFLALLLGHHDHALAHYNAELSRYRNTGYRVPLMWAQNRVGQTLIRQADEMRAKSHLFDALREAAAIGAFQVLLEALLGIAQLSIVPPTLAIELLVLVRENTASNRYSRTQAKRLLSTMELPLTSDELTNAAECGLALTLEAAIALVEPFDSGAETAQDRANQQLFDSLSHRELEVLALIAAGYTNQEIADQLYIGVSTVKKHVNHIYSKLDVTHRAQAVACARTLNILP